MVDQTLTVGEDGRLEIVCRREHDAMANASLASLEGEVTFILENLDPGESVQILTSGKPQE